jgi:hypothetical protein
VTALSAARQTQSRNLEHKHDYKLAAVKVYAGGIAMLDSAGYATPAAASLNNNGCVGVFTETVDNSGGSAGDLVAEVQEGEFRFAGNTLAQANVGDIVYAEDDQTIDETQSGNEPRCGFLAERVSASVGWVRIALGLNQ